jgi:hypothetical protein
LTKEDITNAVRIFFSYRSVKLFKNEPHKKKIRGCWQAIKDLGYPPGTPDTMGWRTPDGKTFGVEIKTINDKLSKVQIKILTMMINDGCIIYIAKEREDGDIDLIDYKTEEKEIIYVQ